MKRIIALIATVVLIGFTVAAQSEYDYKLPQGFTFSNEIGSDVVVATGNAHKENVDTNWRSEFAGIYDKISIGYSSELIAFTLAPKFGVRDVNENYYLNNNSSEHFGHGYNASLKQRKADANGSLQSDDLAFNYWGFDWGVRFSPFELIDVYVNDDVNIVGSNLSARGTNWGAKNLGSDGVAIIITPINNLRISGAIPFGFDFISNPNYMDAEVEDSWITSASSSARTEDYHFHVDIGADYVIPSGLVGVGVKVNDVINPGNRWYGIYSAVNFGNISANVGYNYSEDYKNFLDAFDDGLIYIGGKQAVAGSASVTLGDLIAAIDAMYNMNNAQSVYDLYAGAKVAYAIIPGKFNADLLLGIAADLGTNAHHGTEEDVKNLTYAMKTINPNFVDLYYSNVELEDVRAVSFLSEGSNTNYGIASSENWQYYTALARSMSNGNLDTTSAAKAALAIRVKPGFSYKVGRNTFDAHINFVNFFDGDGSYQIKFPVSWKIDF